MAGKTALERRSDSGVQQERGVRNARIVMAEKMVL
jgi:hypothetical protein